VLAFHFATESVTAHSFDEALDLWPVWKEAVHIPLTADGSRWLFDLLCAEATTTNDPDRVATLHQAALAEAYMPGVLSWPHSSAAFLG
jgi:hypothetical protein